METQYLNSTAHKNYGKSPPLHIAAARGDINKVKFLLNAGANCNEQTNGGCAPLHAVTMSGNGDLVEVTEILLAAGADPNVRECHGHTPLLLAALAGYSGVVRALIKADADPNTSEYLWKWTPLHAAAVSMQAKPEIIIDLLLAGAYPTLTDSGKHLVQLAKENPALKDEPICHTLPRIITQYDFFTFYRSRRTPI